jgi:hypothetical protein
MYPHERSLVEKFAGRPFAIIGINSDSDLEKLRPRLVEEKITWRSFWNGPYGTNGPISAAWAIRSWPGVFVLDHLGVIRHKNLRREADLDPVLEQMVAEAEAAAKSSGK